MEKCCEKCVWATDIGDDLYYCAIDRRTKDPEMICGAFTDNLLGALERARCDSNGSEMLDCD